MSNGDRVALPAKVPAVRSLIIVLVVVTAGLAAACGKVGNAQQTLTPTTLPPTTTSSTLSTSQTITTWTGSTTTDTSSGYTSPTTTTTITPTTTLPSTTDGSEQPPTPSSPPAGP
jgi:hypothetical protein